MESNVWNSVVCDLCKKRVAKHRNCAKCHVHVCLKCGPGSKCPICERGTLLEQKVVVP